MQNGIVTGCAGFIGSHLVDKLLQNDWKIFGCDNFHSYYSRKLKEHNLINAKRSKNFSFIEGSILSENDLEKFPDATDYLFHYAAIAGVRNSILHPEEYFKINLDGTKKLLQRFPSIKIINKWPKDAFEEIKTDQNTALIALTHDPKIDDPALQYALKNKFFYIGALGSKKTHLNRTSRLKKAGFADNQINKIFGPIGIKLGGKSAPEIALSIVAQLVSESHKL